MSGYQGNSAVRIGFDGRFLRKRQTGNGTSTQQLLQNLARIDVANDYTVYLVEDAHIFHQGNFRFKKMPSLHAWAHLRFLFTFPMELKRNPVDIFHGLYTIPFLPYRSFTKIVLTLTEFSWFINPDDFPASRLFMAQVRLTTRYSIKRADKIITPTQYMKRQMIDYLDLPAEKIAVIPWGVNENFLTTCNSDELSETRKKFGIQNEYLLTVGDLHPRKNLNRLIKAFERLKRKENIPQQLVIAGKDLYKSEEIYRCAELSSVRDSVIFTGYVSFEELRALYQGAAVFVFPSLDEGFGLPIHEAMASRIPVVSSNRGTLPEVGGDAAIYVDPLDEKDIALAIFQVLENQDLRLQLVRKGLDQISSYTWRDSCSKILTVYRELLNEGGRVH